jgi:hypothetical protein
VIPPWLADVRNIAVRDALMLYEGVRPFLRWASHHTGLPIAVIAAIATFASWRIMRRTAPVFIEVAFAVTLLAVATHAGLLHW